MGKGTLQNVHEAFRTLHIHFLLIRLNICVGCMNVKASRLARIERGGEGN